MEGAASAFERAVRAESEQLEWDDFAAVFCFMQDGPLYHILTSALRDRDELSFAPLRPCVFFLDRALRLSKTRLKGIVYRLAREFTLSHRSRVTGTVVAFEHFVSATRSLDDWSAGGEAGTVLVMVSASAVLSDPQCWGKDDGCARSVGETVVFERAPRTTFRVAMAFPEAHLLLLESQADAVLLLEEGDSKPASLHEKLQLLWASRLVFESGLRLCVDQSAKVGWGRGTGDCFDAVGEAGRWVTQGPVEHRMLVVAGPPGAGKTVFAMRLTSELLRGGGTLIPLLVHLPHVVGGGSADQKVGWLDRYLCEQHGLTTEELLELRTSRDVAIIIDGLDQVLWIREALRKAGGVLEQSGLDAWHRAVVIVTSRDDIVRMGEVGRAFGLGAGWAVDSWTLQNLVAADAERVIMQAAAEQGNAPALEELRTALGTNRALNALVGNPFLAWAAGRAIGSGAPILRLSSVSRQCILRYFCRAWFMGALGGAAKSEVKNTIQQGDELCREVAWHLEASGSVGSVGHWVEIARRRGGCALLEACPLRSLDWNDNDAVFVFRGGRMLQEWFAARAVLQNPALLESMTTAGKTGVLREAGEIIRGMPVEERRSWRARLLGAVVWTRDERAEERDKIMGANAATLMAAGGLGMAGENLRSVWLRGAVLERAFLPEADLSGAELGSAVLAAADLSGANLGWSRVVDADMGMLRGVTRAHGGSAVLSLDVSPSERSIASGGSDGVVKLWTLDGDFEREVRLSDDARSSCVCWSPDGELLICGYADGTLAAWTPSGQQRWMIQGHDDRVMLCCWQPNGNSFASAGYDDKVRIWDNGGKLLKEVVVSEAVSALAFSPDGSLLAGGLWCGPVLVWTREGARRLRLGGQELAASTAWSLHWAPDGEHIAVGFSCWGVRVWDSEGLLFWESGAGWDAHAVRWSQDGACLAAGFGDGTLQIWSRYGEMLCRLEGHDKLIRSIRWIDHPVNGRLVTSASDDGNIRFWSRWDRNECETGGHSGGVRCVRWAPQGTYLASAGDRGEGLVWNTDGIVVQRLPEFGSGDHMWVLSWSADGQRIVMAGGYHIIVSDLSGTVLMKAKCDGALVQCVDWANGGIHLAFGTDGGGVGVLEVVDTGLVLVAETLCHDERCGTRCVSWAAGGGHLASAGDAQVCVWKLENGQVPSRSCALLVRHGGCSLQFSKVQALKGHEDKVTGVCWDNAGLRLASTSEDGTVCVWNPTGQLWTANNPCSLECVCWGEGAGCEFVFAGSAAGDVLVYSGAGELLHRLADHSGGVVSISWAPVGLRIASAGLDRTVRVWSLEQQRVAVVGALQSGVTGVRGETSADGTRFVCARGQDGEVQKWPCAVPADEVVAIGRLVIASVHGAPSGKWHRAWASGGTVTLRCRGTKIVKAVMDGVTKSVLLEGGATERQHDDEG